MFTRFEEYFHTESRSNISDEYRNDPVLCFRNMYGGHSFGKGIYRVIPDSDIEKWSRIVKEAYAGYSKDFDLFSYDWLGRFFAVKKDANDKENNVIMFEIGTGNILNIPCGFLDFLNDEIPQNADVCLAEDFFEEWMNISGTELLPNQCAGYKVPLFLDGEDDIPNLEVSDLEVYWGILGQLRNRIM